MHVLGTRRETHRLNNKAILKQGEILAIIVMILLLPPFLNKSTAFNNYVLASLTVGFCSKSTKLTANNVNSSLPQEEADPVFSGNNLYVGWTANQSTSQEVFFRASHNKGVSFGPTINLSNDPISSDTNPRIAASGANVYAVWQNFRVGQSVFLRASHDSGVTFGKKINISNGSGTFLQLTYTDLWLPQVINLWQGRIRRLGRKPSGETARHLLPSQSRQRRNFRSSREHQPRLRSFSGALYGTICK
jgi:hypothetical protein